MATHKNKRTKKASTPLKAESKGKPEQGLKREAKNIKKNKKPKRAQKPTLVKIVSEINKITLTTAKQVEGIGKKAAETEQEVHGMAKDIQRVERADEIKEEGQGYVNQKSDENEIKIKEESAYVEGDKEEPKQSKEDENKANSNQA
ncbi:hypothetical protein CCACVL1_06332 [Corchorus capsularis]|uniref:Uncharacterized protein n=1 Tax=Corchorus capsularis TaxID=210143 RepID=A0A1R3JG56_COCAP|nr:hypothetical protein CCACVL1_06332 [Corchorus capsularis]